MAEKATYEKIQQTKWTCATCDHDHVKQEVPPSFCHRCGERFTQSIIQTVRFLTKPFFSPTVLRAKLER